MDSSALINPGKGCAQGVLHDFTGQCICGFTQSIVSFAYLGKTWGLLEMDYNLLLMMEFGDHRAQAMDFRLF